VRRTRQKLAGASMSAAGRVAVWMGVLVTKGRPTAVQAFRLELRSIR